MSGAVLVTPAFVSPFADSGDVTRLGPAAWNAARLFGGGTAGELLMRDPASATGASWTTPTIGNAASATVLQTARTINGVSFNGSADVTVPAAAGTLTGSTLAAGVTGAAQIWTAPQTVVVNGLAAATADGLLLQNTTPASAAVPVQMSPRLRLRAQVWNTTAGATNSNDWWIEVLPTSSAAPTGALRFTYQTGSAPLVIDSSGTAYLSGSLVAAGSTFGADALIAAGGYYRWTGRTRLLSPADAQVNLVNNGTTIGVGLDFATDAVLKIRTRAQTGYATVDALGYRVSGVAIDTEAAGFVDAGNSGTAKTLDLATSRHQRLVLTGNATVTLSNPTDGARYVLHIGTGAGGFGVTWPAAVVWPGGTAPTLTTAANKTDIVVLIYSATTGKYYGAVSQAY